MHVLGALFAAFPEGGTVSIGSCGVPSGEGVSVFPFLSPLQLSQVFEEKNSLSLQLKGSSRNLRESHQRYSEILMRSEALEKQLQELQLPVKDTVRPRPAVV